MHADEKLQVKFFVYCLEHASRLADAQRERFWFLVGVWGAVVVV
jgi:hypothetical protein